MKFTKIAPIAAFGLVGASLTAAAPHGDRAALLEGTWHLEMLREDCEDITGERRGERWVFMVGGAFDRSLLLADGTRRHSTGRYMIQHQESELQLILDSGDGGRSVEGYPILTLDETRLELLSPTQVRQGVVIQQERYAAFFHS